MAKIHVEVLSEKEIEAIHAGTMQILRDTGVMVHHEEALELLRQAGPAWTRQSWDGWADTAANYRWPTASETRLGKF